MNNDKSIQTIILKGSWLYGGDSLSPVRIIEQNYDFWHEVGRADGNLEPEERAELNEEGMIYYVSFKACETAERPWWVESKGFMDLKAAMAHAEERVLGPVTWEPRTEQIGDGNSVNPPGEERSQ